MSTSYVLLKENKQEETLFQSPSNNQTVLHKDANASSALSTLQTLEWSMSDILILTLILFSINVLFKLIEKLLDYLREKFHAYPSKTDTAHHEAKENSSTQSSSESSKDPQ
ncbi:hypothetical protein SUSP_002692 (plasmid) [Sulfurospirillum sp. 'SP']|nr:hypothetical protein [Sulfurospirillum sp. 'SP']WNZ00275.1 hypothetical protein SUSP_002692 [Sulfurospirillum sp. 'SP']